MWLMTSPMNFEKIAFWKYSWSGSVLQNLKKKGYVLKNSVLWQYVESEYLFINSGYLQALLFCQNKACLETRNGSADKKEG